MSEKTIDISYRRILRITWPVMLSQLSYTAMGVIDTVMVGRLGVTALAGVGLGAMLVWWLLSLLFGAVAGVNTAVAQAVGAGDRRGVGESFWHGIYMTAALGLSLTVAWPVIPHVLAWIDPGAEVASISRDYLGIRLLSCITLVPWMVADAFYKGLGLTRIPMHAAMAQLVLNCGLNYLFIFGKLGFPALGAPGSALGTVVAQSLVGLALMASLLFGPLGRRYRLRSTWRPQPTLLRALLAMSLPIGVQSFMEMGGVSVFTALVARLGEAEMAATNAVIQHWSVAFMAAFGLSVGATTLVGQCVGAGDLAAARRTVKRVLLLGTLLMGALGSVYLALPEWLMAVFVQGEDLARLLPFARPLFTVVALCLLLDLAFMVFSGALRGAGDTSFPMWVNVSSAWLVFVPLVWWVTPRWGVVASWSCFVVHLALMALVLGLRFRSGAWRGKSLRERRRSAETIPAERGKAGAVPQ